MKFQPITFEMIDKGAIFDGLGKKSSNFKENLLTSKKFPYLA